MAVLSPHRQPSETFFEAITRHLESGTPEGLDSAKALKGVLEDSRDADGPYDPDTEAALAAVPA